MQRLPGGDDHNKRFGRAKTLAPGEWHLPGAGVPGRPERPQPFGAITAGVPIGTPGSTNLIKAQKVE